MHSTCFLRTYVKSSTGTINHDKVFLYYLCALQHSETTYSDLPNKRADHNKRVSKIFFSFKIITWKRQLGGFFFHILLDKVEKKSKKNKWACSFIREFRVCTLYIRQIVLHMFVKVFKCIVLKESQLNIHFDKLISNIPKEKYNSLNFHALHILYSL